MNLIVKNDPDNYNSNGNDETENNKEESACKKQKLNANNDNQEEANVKSTTNEEHNKNGNNTIANRVDKSGNKICKHFVTKKNRLCKFSALKNLDYCVAHLAFNDQTDNPDKRIVCPLDPKHSVYEKNLERHLKKCNSKVVCLGSYDVKDINVFEKENSKTTKVVADNKSIDESIAKPTLELTTYKELEDSQLKQIIEYLQSLDKRFVLHDLEFNKLENEFLAKVVEEKQDKSTKHLGQISSIVSHVEVLLQAINDKDDNKNENESICLVELGAGRGKLSYWYEQSRLDKASKDSGYVKKKLNIVLIERGTQKYKFDFFFKKESSDFQRIRIDLKHFFLNEVELFKKSQKCLLYGKHLCGVATDYALRCLKYSLESSFETHQPIKTSGLVLAVCCHHQCEWESFCGKGFFEELNIDSKMFYILRSMTSWCAQSNETNKQVKDEIVHGVSKQKIGRICKNLFDYARVQYLKKTIKLPTEYELNVKMFYYIEKDVTVENVMIYACLEKVK